MLLGDSSSKIMEKDLGSGISEEEMRIWQIIAQDDADEFANILRNSELIKSGNFVKLKFGGSELSCHEILRGICFHRAIRCGRAMMEGRDGVVVDLNVPNIDGIFPLHEAACSLSPGLVDLFLQNGAKANCRLVGLDSEKKGLLPIQIALEMLRSDEIVKTWKPYAKQFMIKLITILCNPKLRDALEAIRLLLHSTEEIGHVISYYALKGKVIELSVLLMVAREKVMGPFTVQYEDGSEASVMLGQFIRQELAALIDLEFYLIGRKKKEEKQWNKLCRKRKSAMMPLLPLLLIFEKVGVAVEAYIQSRPADVGEEDVAEDVTRLLTEAGFKIKRRKTRSRTVEDSSVDLVSKQPIDLTEEKVRQIEDTMKGESSGEDADAQLCDKQDSSHRTNADVHAAIEELSTDRRLCQWTPRQSVIKLIIMLCLPEMKHVLDTAKSLELSRKEISEAACYFAMKGKLIELTILLMVFREEAMGPVCAYESEGYFSSDTPILFRQFVRGELAALVDLEFYLMGRKEKEEKLMFKLCKERQSAMLKTLPLLRVFDKAGISIEAYVQARPADVQEEQVVQDIARLLVEEGFKLKPRDIDISKLIDRTSLKISWKHKGMLIQVSKRQSEETTKDVSQMEKIAMPPYLQPCHFLDTHKSRFGMTNDLQRFFFARNNRDSFGLSSNVRQFHTFWTSGGSLLSGFPKVREVRLKKISGMEQKSRKVPATNWVNAFALAAKRVIRRV